MSSSNITIVEGTTKFINVDVLNGDGSRMNLEGFTAFLSIACDNTLVIRRECEIADNVVSTKILPEDTIDRVNHNMKYEIRIIGDEAKTVLAIQTGKIKVTDSIDPIIIEDSEEINRPCN